MNTLHTRLMGLTLLVPALLISGCSKQNDTGTETAATAVAAPAPGFDFNGVWQASSGETLKPVTGELPFTEAAAKQYAATQAAINKGDTSWDATLKCLPPSLPRLLATARPFEVMVDSHLVAMTFELQRLVRFVYLDQMYPTNSDSAYLGEAHGKWEGKQLVVESTKFKTGTPLDATGIPFSDQLSITERFEMTAPDTVINHVTITDPLTFTQPWQTDITLKKLEGVQVQEDVCVERQGIHP